MLASDHYADAEQGRGKNIEERALECVEEGSPEVRYEQSKVARCKWQPGNTIYQPKPKASAHWISDERPGGHIMGLSRFYPNGPRQDSPMNQLERLS